MVLIHFTKMHGLKNDYVIVDGRVEELQTVDLPSLAVVVSNRHTGIGSDGLILVLPPTIQTAHARMQMFNADGSEAEMCGNGVRCISKFILDREAEFNGTLRIETLGGIVSVAQWELDGCGKVDTITVSMGTPVVDPSIVLNIRGVDYHLYLVSIGNPHAVIFVDDGDLGTIHLDIGPLIEKHKAFSNGTNVHFVKVNSESEVTVNHWERGSGATMACGSGACAVCIAGIVSSRTANQITAHLPGGDLLISSDYSKDEYDQARVVQMSGPAREVFNGVWIVDE